MLKFGLIFPVLLTAALAGRIDPSLKLKVGQGLLHEGIIELPQIMGQVENNKTIQALTGNAKVSALVSTLMELTSSAQSSLVASAKGLGLHTEQFWASNIVAVKGLTTETLERLAAIDGEFLIREQHTAFIIGDELGAVDTKQGPQWNINKIRAPAAWTLTSGEGSVVGIIDTGVNLGHAALPAASFAGAWLDPYYATALPTDQQGHGSHVTGIAVGRANGIGVAPGARWVACRGLNHQGSGSESALIECGQFMMTANPRPHVVSNSWGGGSGSTWFNTVISAWRNAGIIAVFAIGNSGPNCRTIGSPGDHPNVISVGATNSLDEVPFSSSRGPVGAAGLKPDFVAPGANILSCGTGANDYLSMSGTSMAAPHMAGGVAIFLSRNPGATYAQVYEAFKMSAVHPPISNADRNCGLPENVDFPNYAYGWGRIDVGAALGV